MINTTPRFLANGPAPQRYKHFIEVLGGKRVRVMAIIFPMIERFPGHREERVIIVGRPGGANEGKIYHDVSHNMFLKLIRMDYFEVDYATTEN